MTTSTQQLADTRAMNVIHTFFRREFRLAGGLLRGVRPGDGPRAAVVADHVAFLTLALHHHHTTEDGYLWPLLLERVPEDLAPIVHLMESQHGRVDGLIEEIDALVPRFRESGDAAVRDRLADLLDTLYVHLGEHLDAEEQRLLPIAARTMTQQEWEKLGEIARATAPKGKGLLVMGMFLHDGGPDGAAVMLAAAPPPVRWLIPRLARRAFRRYALHVHGTATP
ncbi:hemerythrin domain-containing protein [Nocardioides sp.]|uniref:hemerythrin domain-containing protein n=1 Tax=Nocardioides sp. TaxID=35761 RepID=UPI001A33B4E6|nr:hemerythrin domain-containing protein [Nocardioides sp.]MBJ7358631.1 hemerythrin domain-containing protein [Nocardioides sp.]